MRSVLIFLISFISIASTTPHPREIYLVKHFPKKCISNKLIQDEIESDHIHQSGKEKIKRGKHSKTQRDNDRAVNRRAIWGFIFGLASITIFPLLAIPGVILSNDALREEKMHPRILTKTNKILAYLGKIFSIIGIAIIIFAILYVAFLIAILSAWG